MPIPRTTTPMGALMAKVDAILRCMGTDPASLTEDDKILFAVQCVEVSTVCRIIFTNDNPEVRRL